MRKGTRPLGGRLWQQPGLVISGLLTTVAAAAPFGDKEVPISVHVALIEGTGQREIERFDVGAELAPGRVADWSFFYGEVEPGESGAWVPVRPRAGWDSGRADALFSPGRWALRGHPYLIGEVSVRRGIRPDPARELELTIAVRRLSGFSEDGRPLYGRTEESRSFGASDAATIPLDVPGSKGIAAFRAEKLVLRAAATPRMPDVAYGELLVRSDTPRAMILVDGGEVGRTSEAGPTRIGNVAAGQREIRVRDLSGRQAQKVVRLSADKALPVTLNLRSSSPGEEERLLPLGRNPQGYAEFWRSRDGASVVEIPAGEFLMGSDTREEESFENPRRTVWLSAYFIDKTEVSWGQYEKFSRATGMPLPPAPLWGTPETYPVTGVTWEEAAAFCEWTDGRLPTEAEWEKAARGIDGRRYPWGEVWEADRCNTRDGGPHRPREIGAFPRCVSPYGALDMSGSVWEFVADWFDEKAYESGPTRDPKGPTSGRRRVVRGGSWLNPNSWARPSFRQGRDPKWRNVLNGFRCARDGGGSMSDVVSASGDPRTPLGSNEGDRRVASQDGARYGAISVRAGRGGAEIFLDGSRVGRTSADGRIVLRNIAVGVHDVRVGRSGRTPRAMVTVRENRTVLVAPGASAPSNGRDPIGRNERGYEQYRRRRDGAVLVRVPEGAFLMGNLATEGRPHPHTVFVSEFLMDKTPVTWGQFERFLEASGWPLPPDEPYWGIHPDHPAVFVTWEESRAYCEWVGARLPTEAEREKAARGTDERKYPWGDAEPTPSLATFRRNWGYEATDPVGSHPAGASPYGLLDMAGNVWEWCEDWWDPNYPKVSPPKDPVGPAKGRAHVVKGGSWDSRPSVLSASARNFGYIGYREGDFGFRCAADP